MPIRGETEQLSKIQGEFILNNIYEEWGKLKPAERYYIATHPQHALSIRKSREIAIKETKKIFSQNKRNDSSDAFRHCFWSATLARDIGYYGAKKFTTAHENFLNNPKEEKEMDLYNNNIGLNIGRYSKANNQRLSAMCMATLIQGKLKTLYP